MSDPWSPQQFVAGARAAGRTPETIEAALASAAKIQVVHEALPVVLTLHHFAHLAGVNVDLLQEIAFRKTDAYRVFRVKKRGVPNRAPSPPRRYRTICVPEPELMRAQRWISQHILRPIAPHPASFAFAEKRDLAGAAKKHRSAKWLVKMDVRRFFESISEEQVYWVFRSLGYGALLSFQLARVCTRLPDHRHDTRGRRSRPEPGLPYPRRPQGHLPQGAPTSPMLANLAMRGLDKRLSALAAEGGWTYTRYADDLAFSRPDGTTRDVARRLTHSVVRELAKAGLRDHRQKTSISPPGARKVLLGVLVDRERPHLSREFRNNLETHLYALTSPKIGASAHQRTRGFASKIGMRRHIQGLIAFANQVDKAYAARLDLQFRSVDWDR